MPSTERGIPLKKSTAEEKRRAMNERRHEYTNKIRKAKKSHLITLKRRYNAATTNNLQPTATTSLQDLCLNYIRQRDISSLAALQSALATSDTALMFELDSRENMILLCNTLAYSLRSDASLEERLLASRVLTNLAAMNTSSSSTTDDASYYSKQPEGWCEILIQSQALPALANALATFATEVDPS